MEDKLTIFDNPKVLWTEDRPRQQECQEVNLLLLDWKLTPEGIYLLDPYLILIF